MNLGLDESSLTAALDGNQPIPATTSTATGTATLSNYSVANKTFDLAVTVTGIAPAEVTGFTFRRGGLSANGTEVLDLLSLVPLVPSGTGFTFTVNAMNLGAFTCGVANEALLLGGEIYLSVATTAFPNGLIRGQVFSTGNVNVPTGTATGTGGISNVENATGETGSDSLVGSFGANTLSGLAGNDIFVGGPGTDTFLGWANADTMIWSNGDGSDVMDCEAGNDRTVVNGNVTAADVFTVGVNGTRVDFDRVSPGPFSLDIGTTESLTVNGIGGDDSFTVNPLSGVADLGVIELFGLAGADTFAITATNFAMAMTASGGVGNDTFTVGGPTLDTILGTVVIDGGGNDATPTTNLTTAGTTNTLPVGDTLTFQDAGDASNNTYTLAETAFSRTGIPDVLIASVESVVLNAGSGESSVTVTATSPNTTTTVNGGTRADTVTVTTTGASSNTALNGGGGADTFTVNGTGTGSVTQVDGGAEADTLSVPTAGSTTPGLTTATDANGVFGGFTFGDRAPVGFTAIEAVNPLITSAAATEFTQAVAGTFTVTAVGVPNATFSITGGTLPAGVTLSPAGVLSGVPSVAGTFAVTITASTGTGPDATQAFILTVEPNVDLFAVATGPGTPVQANVFSADGHLRFALSPFGGFTSGATVATGDMTGDGVDDIAAAAGPGGGPHVKVFDGGTGAEIRSFFAYAAGFTGGVFVGLGDVTGDGKADLVTGAGVGGGPHVKVFDGHTLTEVHSFFAYDVGFRGGVSVQAGDLDGDGRADIITGAGPGGGPHVKAFSGSDLTLLQSFFAGSSTSSAGVYVGIGNFDPTSSRPEIVAGVNGVVRVFGAVSPVQAYIEQDSVTPFGVGVAAAPAAVRLDDGVIAILVGAVGQVAPHVQIIDIIGDTLRNSFFAFDAAFHGGVNVG